MLVIEGRAIGRKRPLFADWSIPFPPDLPEGGGPTTLRDLISRIVRTEVQAFRERQEERRIARVLTRSEIESGTEKGKIDPIGRDLRQAVDEDDAVATALQAFEDGLFLVVLDGIEQCELDREVFVAPDSRVTFVRLVMLAGA